MAPATSRASTTTQKMAQNHMNPPPIMLPPMPVIICCMVPWSMAAPPRPRSLGLLLSSSSCYYCRVVDRILPPRQPAAPRRIRMSRQASDQRAQRLRRHWDKHARTYDKQMAFWERRLFADGRHWVCAQASGEVLEVAIGTGRNLPYYPKGIRLTGIDFSPQMLELARRQADQLGRKVDLRLG